MKTGKWIIVLLSAIMAIYSCTDDQCNSETESLLKSEFLVIDTNLIAINYLDSLSIYAPEWKDSIHYSEEGSEKLLYFTLSPESDTSEFIITSLQAPLNDTIFIYYHRKTVLISTECGFATDYTIDTILYTNNYIDSLDLVNETISTEKNGHIQIYF